MKVVEQSRRDERLNECLATRGLRFTPQRHHVYEVLRQSRDHPTAEDVFMRAKNAQPEISMATVYNCLDALVQCGLVKLVNRHRGATRYCANLKEHWHFYCDACESVFDVAATNDAARAGVALPRGFTAERYEIAVHGRCAACNQGRRGGPG